MLKPIVKAALVALGILISNEALATKLLFPSPKATFAPPNAAGDRLYFVLLRNDYVMELGDAGVPPPIAPSDMKPTDDPRAWHRAEARKMVSLLEQQYGFSAIAMTSWIAPSLTTYLSQAQLEALEADSRVDTIAFVTAGKESVTFSASPPWNDYVTGSEEVSYGKVATDTDDNVTPTIKVYMIDSGTNAIVMAHQDLDGGFLTNPSTGTSTCSGFELHGAAVASILSAEHGNSVGIKGVNNAGPVVSVPRGPDCTTTTNTLTALEWAVEDMESKGITGVINISSNGTDFADGSTAYVAKYMRRASARALIVESAGNNNNSNACTYAYSPTLDFDGILVVGGVNTTGARVAGPGATVTPPSGGFDESQAWFGIGSTDHSKDEPGSNYGSCVEVWAPGQLIWTAYPDGSGTSNVKIIPWGGTSFAAPIVSAMAARYGNATTNPVIREAYIRSKLFTANSDDGSSRPVKVPSYTQTPLFTLPTKLAVVNSVVSSIYSTYAGTNAYDGNYLTTMWNSGVTPSYPSTQPFIELDLGSTKTLYSMRFMPAQSPSGTSTHDVYVGTTSPATTFVGSITRDIMNGETMSMSLSGYSARYVRLVTHASPSWAAYYEVEVFGN